MALRSSSRRSGGRKPPEATAWKTLECLAFLLFPFENSGRFLVLVHTPRPEKLYRARCQGKRALAWKPVIIGIVLGQADGVTWIIQAKGQPLSLITVLQRLHWFSYFKPGRCLSEVNRLAPLQKQPLQESWRAPDCPPPVMLETRGTSDLPAFSPSNARRLMSPFPVCAFRPLLRPMPSQS